MFANHVLTMQNCLLQTAGAPPLAKRVASELARSALAAINDSGATGQTVTSRKNLGSPETDDPKHLLAVLLCAALGLPCDYL
jgi:hypothetical protein